MMKRNAERMQYRSDRLSYWLCMLSIIFDMVYFVSIYANKDVTPDVTIGADILINIIFMMMVFLSSEKLKSYQKKWNIYIILLGIAQILRVFWIPVHFYKLELLMGIENTLVVIWILVSGILLLIAGINSSINLKVLNRFVVEGKVGE